MSDPIELNEYRPSYDQQSLASITSWRGLKVETYRSQYQGPALEVGLVAPFSSTMSSWVRERLHIRFRPQALREPIVIVRPKAVLWRHDLQYYLVVVAPLTTVINPHSLPYIDVSIDGVTWRNLPIYDRLASPKPLAAYDYRLITRHLVAMTMDYPPRCRSNVRSTTVIAEINTTWLYADWLRGNTTFRLTLTSGDVLEADVGMSEVFLVGTTKFSAVFDRLIRDDQVLHLDLVLPTSPTDFFVQRLY